MTPSRSPPGFRLLPPYLMQSEPLEMEDLPLQVHLLTLEVKAMREAMDILADLLLAMETAVRPAATGLEEIGDA